MTDYLSYSFEDTPELVNTFDELPLWSASFGLLLFKHLQIKKYPTVLDLGSGAGFPLIELAERLGTTCKVYGLDSWKNANDRARVKLKNYGIHHVEILDGTAEQIPFKDNSVDLIVSNLGIHNFNNPDLVFQECHRVLKYQGTLAMTTNLNGHWKEFYEIFYLTLRQLNKEEFIPALKKDESHRGTAEMILSRFTENGFTICNLIQESFEMKFLKGSAFLNHHFVKLGWLNSWTSLFPKEELRTIFSNLENNLNAFAEENNGLALTVPMAYIDGENGK